MAQPPQPPRRSQFAQPEDHPAFKMARRAPTVGRDDDNDDNNDEYDADYNWGGGATNPNNNGDYQPRREPHPLCVNNFLIISRSRASKALCLMNSTNNVLQQPGLITRQVILAFGYDKDMDDMEGRLTSFHIELSDVDMCPDIADVAMVLDRCGWVKSYADEDNIIHRLKDFTSYSSKGEFMRQQPSGFWLCGQLKKFTAISGVHFEAVVFKAGCYWLLIGIHNSKVVKLGNLTATADLLFSRDGRDRIAEVLNKEYNKNAGQGVSIMLGAPWDTTINGCFDSQMQLILVPMLTSPSGFGKSMYDSFGSTQEVIAVLERDMTVRKDPVVPTTVKFAVQVIDLNDRKDIEKYTIDLGN